MKDYVVVFDKTALTNIADLDNNLRNYNHEEADTGIILHALDVSKRDRFSELVVFCSDTDVLLILLHDFDKLSSSTIFKTINREFVLRKTYGILAPSVCKALLGFQAISGCDQTGRFSGFSKISFWEIFLDLPNNVLDEFSSLGGSTLLSDSALNTLEQFVLWLYCKNKVPSGIKNLSDLRWKMFSKQQADSQRLPPTSDTFRQKVLRSHYTVIVWKQSHVPSQALPNPE